MVIKTKTINRKQGLKVKTSANKLMSKQMRKKNTTNRTENSIIRMKLNTKKNKKLMSPYLDCVFNPFGSANKGMQTLRPDGVGNCVMVMDFLGSTDFYTSPNAGFNIRIMPTLPSPVAFSNNASVTTPAPAMTIVSNGVTITPSTTVAANYFLPGPNGLMTPFVGTQPLSQPGAVSARYNTVGWVLMYTGAPTTCSGNIQIDQVPLKIDTSNIPNTQVLSLLDGTGTATTKPANSVRISVLDMLPNGPVTPTKKTLFCRPDELITGILKFKDNQHNFKPFFEYPNALVSDISALTGTIPTMFNNMFVGSSVYTGVSWTDQVSLIDDSLTATNIAIQSVGSSMSFKLLTWQCIEYELSPSSFNYNLGIKSPPINTSVLNAADKQNNLISIANTSGGK
jgi:hypothetical protein